MARFQVATLALVYLKSFPGRNSNYYKLGVKIFFVFEQFSFLEKEMENL
jgi:hypothetical protein